MKSIVRQLTVVGLLVVFAIGAVSAATKPPSKTNKAKLGTTQASGQNAKIGVTYTLGKVNPLNITLDKVEYTLEPVLFGKNPVWPMQGEKIMILHYTLHNPNPRDFGLSWNTFEITAVDANDKNWRFYCDVAIEGTHEKAYMTLKRAQKTKVYTCILVPAEREIPKLIFQSHDRLVLRYDLRGKVKPLSALLADPSDASGATASEKISAKMGEFYPLRGLHAKIDSVAFSTAPVKGKAPKRGSRYLAIVGTAKNNMPNPFRFAWSSLKMKVADADGGDVHIVGEPLFASRDDNASGTMEQGQELRFRFIFEVPDNVKLRDVVMSQSGSHAFVYDLSQVQ